MTLKCLATNITPKNTHLITLSDEKSGTMLFKALKTGFVENKKQSGPLSVVSKGPRQMSVVRGYILFLFLFYFIYSSNS